MSAATLRDERATAAMSVLLQAAVIGASPATFDDIAYSAFLMADAMQRASEPRPGSIPVGDVSDFGGLDEVPR